MHSFNLFKSLTLLLCFFLYSSILYAAQATAQATIIEAEGYACMGDDKSKKQTEQFALADAKRKAAEAALTYVKSETKVENSEVQKDLSEAFSNAHVRIIKELDKSWYKDKSTGDCYKIKIKAEITPDMETIALLERPSIQSNNSRIDTAWHKYQSRKLDIWGRAETTSEISVLSDGWRLIGPTSDNKDEYEWGWEVTLSITPSAQDAGRGHFFVGLKKINYTLLDEDGFVLITDKLDLSGFGNSLQSDDGTFILLHEMGTTKTYRQTSKMIIQKALRAKASKYLISVD